MKLLAAIATLAAASTVHADSFEANAQGAQRVKDLANVAWALTTTCEAGDDVQQRQCRHLRDARIKELTSANLVIDAKPSAFEVGAWSAAKKSIPISLTACIDCAGLQIDGKTLYVTGQNAQPVMDSGKLKALRLLDTARAFSDEGSAVAWLKSVGDVRIQLVVKVPEKVRWQAAGREGLGLEILAYRVYAPCEGTVVVANPPSGPIEADKKACAKQATATSGDDFELDGEPGDLTTAQVVNAMTPVVAAGRACFERYKIAGTAKLDVTIAADGSVAGYAQRGDHANTPTGRCLDTAMKRVTFPKSSKRVKLVYPITLK